MSVDEHIQRSYTLTSKFASSHIGAIGRHHELLCMYFCIWNLSRDFMYDCIKTLLRPVHGAMIWPALRKKNNFKILQIVNCRVCKYLLLRKVNTKQLQPWYQKLLSANGHTFWVVQSRAEKSSAAQSICTSTNEGDLPAQAKMVWFWSGLKKRLQVQFKKPCEAVWKKWLEGQFKKPCETNFHTIKVVFNCSALKCS